MLHLMTTWFTVSSLFLHRLSLLFSCFSIAKICFILRMLLSVVFKSYSGSLPLGFSYVAILMLSMVVVFCVICVLLRYRRDKITRILFISVQFLLLSCLLLRFLQIFDIDRKNIEYMVRNLKRIEENSQNIFMENFCNFNKMYCIFLVFTRKCIFVTLQTYSIS